MGLDQYLRAEVPAPEGSPFHKVIEEYLTDDQRKELVAFEPDYPNYTPYAYVSGWSYGDAEPDALFTALSLELGFEPTKDSPSFHIKKAPNGYLIEATIYYWRKANAIHRWFVEECQGGVHECQETLVHPEMLMDLIDRCEQVAADHSKCHDLLPTVGGFFFGSTEYDEWYFRDVEETATGLKEAVAAIAPKASRFIYQSSW